MVEAGGVSVAYGVNDDATEVDAVVLQFAPLVESSQQEKIFHQTGHALGLGFNAV